MNAFYLSLILILAAGIFQGTFGLGMKRYAALAWEIFWALFAIIGMALIPWLWAFLVIPDPWAAIRLVPSADLLTSVLLGGCWGIGALLFGLSINYIGLSLAYGITMSLAAAMGSLIPLAGLQGLTASAAVRWILASILVMLAGVGLLSYAGILREKVQSESGKVIPGIRRGKGFYLGLLYAILNGFGAALLNVGFTRAQPAAQAAIKQGTAPREASLVAWVIVLFGGLVVNLAYSSYLSVVNKSYLTIRRSGAIRSVGWAVFTAVLWFAALGGYGQGAAIMGRLGPVIGWSMFLGLSLIVSSVLGLKDREWTGLKRPLIVLLSADGVLLVSVCMLGYANYLALR